MLSFLRRAFSPRSQAPVAPQLDEAVAQRLEAEGRDLQSLRMEQAQPTEAPPRPALPGFTGAVRFELTVDATGTVKAVQMEGAPFAHVQELEDWAYAWVFRPAQLDGKPHACRMVYEVTW